MRTVVILFEAELTRFGRGNILLRRWIGWVKVRSQLAPHNIRQTIECCPRAERRPIDEVEGRKQDVLWRPIRNPGLSVTHMSKLEVNS
jgi:hypothetical protein